MNYIDRWIMSMTVATVALFVLMAVIGIPRHLWLDLLHTWLVVVIVNHIRLELGVKKWQALFLAQ